jgi:hypothetical protein
MTYRPHIIASSCIPGRSVQTMKCCASWRQWAPWHCSLGTLRKTLQTRESVFRRCLNFIGSSQMRHNARCLTMSASWRREFLICQEESRPVLILSRLRRCSARACANTFSNRAYRTTVKALQSTSSAMTSAQKELSTALHDLSDSHGGVVAQVQYANNRLEYALESRAKTIDALLHEWKSDLLSIWIPMIAGAAMLIGLFGGIEIQGCRDSVPPAEAKPTQTAVPSVPNPEPLANDAPASNLRSRRESREKVRSEAQHER